MSLPQSIDATQPDDSDPRHQVRTEIGSLKQYLVDVFGLPSGSTQISNAAFSITASSGKIKFPNTWKKIPMDFHFWGSSKADATLISENLPVFNAYHGHRMTFDVPDDFDITKNISIHFDYCNEKAGNGNFGIKRRYAIYSDGEKTTTRKIDILDAQEILISQNSAAFTMGRYQSSGFDIYASHINGITDNIESRIERRTGEANDTASGRLYFWNIMIVQK